MDTNPTCLAVLISMIGMGIAGTGQAYGASTAGSRDAEIRTALGLGEVVSPLPPSSPVRASATRKHATRPGVHAQPSRTVRIDAAFDGAQAAGKNEQEHAANVAYVRAIFGFDDDLPASAGEPLASTPGRHLPRVNGRMARSVPEITLPALAEVAALPDLPRLSAAPPPAPRKSVDERGTSPGDSDADRAMSSWLADLTISVPSQPTRNRDEPFPMIAEALPTTSRRTQGRLGDSLVLPVVDRETANDLRYVQSDPLAPLMAREADEVLGYDDKLLALLKVLEWNDSAEAAASENAGAHAFHVIAQEMRSLTIVPDAAAPTPPMIARFELPRRRESQRDIAVNRPTLEPRPMIVTASREAAWAPQPLLAAVPRAPAGVGPDREAVLPRVFVADGGLPTTRRLADVPVVQHPLDDTRVEATLNADRSRAAPRVALAAPEPIVVTNTIATSIAQNMLLPATEGRLRRPSANASALAMLEPLLPKAERMRAPAERVRILPRIPLSELEETFAPLSTPASIVAAPRLNEQPRPPVEIALNDRASDDQVESDRTIRTGTASSVLVSEAPRAIIQEAMSVAGSHANEKQRGVATDRPTSRASNASNGRRLLADGGASEWFDIFDPDLSVARDGTRAAATSSRSKRAQRARQSNGIVIASSLGKRIAFSKLADDLMPAVTASALPTTSAVALVTPAAPRTTVPADASDSAQASAVAKPADQAANIVVEIPRVLDGSRGESTPVRRIAKPEEMIDGLEGKLVALSDDKLDSMRAGFETPTGLQISFGIERAVYINGSLVTTTSVNVADLGRMTAGQALQSGLERTTLALIQNGPNNAFNPGQLSTGSVTTVIQNTLDNQKIQGTTLINATVNSLDLAKRSDLQNSIQNGITGSLRR